MSIYQCYVAFMNAMFNISTSKHIHYKLKVSDKTKRRKRGNDFAKQEVMSLRTQAPCKARAFLEYKMASAGAAIWLPDTERFFMELRKLERIVKYMVRSK